MELVDQNTEQYDAVIIGGGPAGMSALLWSAELGQKALLIERGERLGGQLLMIHNAIDNYLGISAKNGQELCDRFVDQVAKVDGVILTGTNVVSVDVQRRSLILSNGDAICAKTLVIAAGVRRRRLGIGGEIEFEGKGVLTSGVAGQDEVIDKEVLIVGGGDAALENALILSKLAKKVIVVHRGEHFSARSEFIDAALSRRNIEFMKSTLLASIKGDEEVREVELKRGSQPSSHLKIDAVLIRIGVIPNSELFNGQVECDGQGYILVDQDGMTYHEGVFAIGDIAHPRSPTISTAVGTGATAAKVLAGYLCKTD